MNESVGDVERLRGRVLIVPRNQGGGWRFWWRVLSAVEVALAAEPTYLDILSVTYCILLSASLIPSLTSNSTRLLL